MNDIDYVSEEDIRVLIEETLDYAVESAGIGYYEYGDGKYNDNYSQLVLTDGTIMVQYQDDVDQAIFTRIVGTLTGYDSDDCDYECDYMAEMLECNWNKENKYWDVKYGVTQI